MDKRDDYEQRRRTATPHRSTPYMKAWRAAKPDKATAARQREDERNQAIDEMATRRKRTWTDDERHFLHTHPDMPHRDIAAALGRTVRSVEGFLRRQRTSRLP